MVKLGEIKVEGLKVNTDGEKSLTDNYDIIIRKGMVFEGVKEESESNMDKFRGKVREIWIDKRGTIWIDFNDKKNTTLPLDMFASQIENRDVKLVDRDFSA